MFVFDIVYSVVILVVLFFVLQLLLGVFDSRKITQETNAKLAPSVVLVPAHNESTGIINTLTSIKSEIGEQDKIVVVADNCSDDTAKIAKQHGVIVVERENKNEIGKGHALQYGVEFVKANLATTKTIIVMDADCLFEEGAFSSLVGESQKNDSVVQALYLMQSPNKDNIKLNISAFTWLIKNWIRPLGQKRMGMSCHLQGSGMAFPISILQKHSLASSNIVEDLELGLKLIESGSPVYFHEHALVTSCFPENEQGLETQRKRWEHGHMSVIGKMPKTMFKALVNRNFKLLFQAFDAAIPPTIALIFIYCLVVLSAFMMGFWIGFDWFFTLVLTLFLLGLSIALAWYKRASKILPINQLGGLLSFVFSKVSVYKSFAKNKEKNWVRTKRD